MEVSYKINNLNECTLFKKEWLPEISGGKGKTSAARGSWGNEHTIKNALWRTHAAIHVSH